MPHNFTAKTPVNYSYNWYNWGRSNTVSSISGEAEHRYFSIIYGGLKFSAAGFYIVGAHR